MNNNNETESDNHHLIRVVFLGDPKVGKTCILYQLFSSVFKDDYVATYGVEFAPLIINLDGGKQVDVQICDASGGESSRAMVLSILKTCPMAIVVYDVTGIVSSLFGIHQDLDGPSFDNVEKWITDLKEKAGANVLIGILGNKIDLENRVVNTEDGERLAKKHAAVFGEVSSKHPSDLETFIKRVGSTLLANNIPS